MLANKVTGLQEEPLDASNISTVEIQVRHQLWWSIVMLDAQVASASGLPPLIESHSHSVEPVYELGDTLYDGSELESSGERKSILGLWRSGTLNFFSHLSGFLHVLHLEALSERDVEIMLAIAYKVRRESQACNEQLSVIVDALKNNNQACRNQQDSSQRTQSNPRLVEFTDTLLSMFAAQPFVEMYGPLDRQDLLDYLKEREPG